MSEAGYVVDLARDGPDGQHLTTTNEQHFVTDESDELMVIADAVRELFQDNRSASGGAAVS